MGSRAGASRIVCGGSPVSGRHIILAPGRAHAIIVLSVAEVCALHTLAVAALDESGRAIHAGVSKHSSGQSSVDAGRRAAEVLADVRRALDKQLPPGDGR